MSLFVFERKWLLRTLLTFSQILFCGQVGLIVETLSEVGEQNRFILLLCDRFFGDEPVRMAMQNNAHERLRSIRRPEFAFG